MPKADSYDDAEVRAYIESLPNHLTYSDMAAACLEKFGLERAWSRSKIVRYWAAQHPTRRGVRSKLDQDPEVRDFLADRLGRLAMDRAIAEAKERFGDRTPGRSSVHRFWKRLRAGRVDRR